MCLHAVIASCHGKFVFKWLAVSLAHHSYYNMGLRVVKKPPMCLTFLAMTITTFYHNAKLDTTGKKDCEVAPKHIFSKL